jgi:alpha-beta hydrolase superfamily lysophospholipase
LDIVRQSFRPKKPTNETHILFLTGWNEAFVKYYELFDDLNALGFHVHTMDHRSQGLSDRPDDALNEHISHLHDFEG